MLYAGKLRHVELVLAQCLRVLVQEGRFCASSTLLSTSEQGIQILRFVANSVVNIEKLLFSVKCFEDFYKNFIDECAGCDMFIEEVKRILECANIDHFYDEIEILKTVFMDSLVTSSNASRTVSLICPDSLLGYFCRSFLARFESMPFEDVCCFFDDLQLFVTAVSKESMEGNFSKAGHELDENNVSLAEDILHRTFDSDLQHALPELMATSASVSAALETFHRTVEVAGVRRAGSFVVAPGAQTKHQYAMLALSVLWVKQSHHTLAFYSLEEAMKIAHQRGDRRTVAQALLLLHYIVGAAQSAPSTRGTLPGLLKSATECFDEELLTRCIERCQDSKQRYLASQCAILLANLKCQRKMQVTAGCADNDHPDAAQHSNGTKPESVWALLRVGLFGDVKTVLEVARGGELSEVEVTPVAGPGGQPSAADGGLLTVAEVVELLLPHAVASVSAWEREGQLDMALLETRRYLRQSLFSENMSVTGSSESICLFLCKSLRCVVERFVPLSILPTPMDAMLVKRIGMIFTTIKRLTSRLESIGPSKTIAVINALRGIKLLIEARKQIFMLNVISFRPTTASLDRSSQVKKISDATLKAVVLYRDFCHEAASDVGLLHQNSVHDAAATEESVEADTLLAIALSRSNTPKACEILSQIVLTCKDDVKLRKHGLKASAFMSFLRLHRLSQVESAVESRAHTLADIDELLLISRKEHYPAIEHLIVHHFTSLSSME